MEIKVKPPQGPVTIKLNDGRIRYEGKKLDVEYVRMMVGDQAGPLGHPEDGRTAFDLERRVFAAFGNGAELISGAAEIRPELKRATTMWRTSGQIP